MSEISKLNPLKAQPLAEKKPQGVSEEKLHEVAELYERHFIREMMKQMRSTVQEGGFIKQNNAEKIFRDQLDDQYAEQWSKAGGIGFSQVIYDQLIEKYGVQFGLKKAEEKPQGPIAVNRKMFYSGQKLSESSNVAQVQSSAAFGEKLEKAARAKAPMTFKFFSPEHEKLEITSPWAGVLLDKKHLDRDQVQYRIKHDNGLESLILTRGTGLGPDQNLSPGDAISAGQQIGWMSAASPLFWTVKPIVSE